VECSSTDGSDEMEILSSKQGRFFVVTRSANSQNELMMKPSRDRVNFWSSIQ
jgi:hypothetical protein